VRTVLICNENDADPGFVGARLEARGYRIERWHREHFRVWPTLEGVDLLFLLGSDWSLYWEHLEEHTECEAQLVREADAAGVPVLGICYGAQMIAHALGGSVSRSPEPEVGWYEIDSDLPEVIERGPWMQWHSDRLTVPPGATELARSPICPQAFLRGRTLGVQFHPEVDRSIVERWSAEGGAEELVRLGVDRRELLDRVQAESVRTEPAAGRLVDWFLDAVVGAVRD